MTVSLDEVNFLISHYLRESGFVHTAFVFENESMVTSSNLASTRIPPGSLISILQKSLVSLKYEKKIKRALKDPNNEFHEDIVELIEKYKEKIVKEPDPAPKEDTPIPDINLQQTINKINQLNVQSPTCINLHTAAYCGKWSYDSTYFISGGDEGKAYIHLIRNNTVFNSINMTSNGSISGAITSIDISPSNDLIVIADFDGDVIVYDRNGQKVNLMQRGSNTSFCVRFSPSGQNIVACNSGTCYFFQSPYFRQIKSPVGCHKDTIVDAAWRGDFCVATASADGTVGIFDLNQPQASFLRLSTKRICGVAWSFDGNCLAVCCEDGSLKYLNVTTWECKNIYSNNLPLHGLKWTNNTLFCWGDNCSLRCIPLGFSDREVVNHDSPILCASFSDIGDVVATGDGNGHVKVTLVANGEVIKEFQGTSSVHDVALNKMGDSLVICFADGDVHYIPYLTSRK